MADTDHDHRHPPRPIIIITGANSGVGYGVALRLLHQLSSPTQSDITSAFLPSSSSSPPPPSISSDFATPNGLTLVLACRNAVKAHKAQEDLLREMGKKPGTGRKGEEWKMERKRRVLGMDFDDDEASSKHGEESVKAEGKPLTEREYRRRWLASLRIEFLPLDLASVKSVGNCVELVKERYPYVTHLLCNAGCGPFLGINWLAAARSFVMNGVLESVTYVDYINEEKSRYTADGLGFTFQCNVFSHYLLARGLLASLLATPDVLAAPRVIWTSSLDALPFYCDGVDWQAAEGGFSYHVTKYEMGLLGRGFQKTIREVEGVNQDGDPRVQSFVCHPGVVAGNMFTELLGVVLDFCMRMVFYVARFFGSPHHPISPYKAAICFTYVLLAPLSLLVSQRSIPSDPNQAKSGDGPLRFDPLGEEKKEDKLGKEKWWDEKRALELVEYLEKLRSGFEAKKL